LTIAALFVCEAIVEVVALPVLVECVDSVIANVEVPLGARNVVAVFTRLLLVVMLVDETLNEDEPRFGCSVACVPVMLPDSP
jgi:hypothetical protein